MYGPWLSLDVWTATRAGAAAIAARQRTRLAELVAYARRRSPAYRERYAGLPDGIDRLDALPPVDKATLMPQLDRWLTDPQLDADEVARFAAQPTAIGSLLRGRYAVWKTSGTTGDIGLFVHDGFALTVYDTLFAARAWPEMSTPPAALGLARHGGRMACVLAREDHFAGISSWRHQARAYPWLAPLMRDFSVLTPLPELCRQLEAWDPGQIVAYPSVLSLLARERLAGRLRLDPAIVLAGGETLDAAEQELIEGALGARVHNVYACSECDYVAFACPHGWLHVNADWVILEPIDADGRPTPPGAASATCLLTNLANRVQPVIRYDLKDSVTLKPEPCPCGRSLPAIRVEGRVNQHLEFADAEGGTVAVLPLAIGTILEAVDGLRRFQVVQTGRRSVEVRCEPAPGAVGEDVHRRTRAAVRGYLGSHGLDGVQVGIADQPPHVDPVSGKLQQVIRDPRL